MKATQAVSTVLLTLTVVLLGFIAFKDKLIPEPEKVVVEKVVDQKPVTPVVSTPDIQLVPPKQPEIKIELPAQDPKVILVNNETPRPTEYHLPTHPITKRFIESHNDPLEIHGDLADTIKRFYGPENWPPKMEFVDNSTGVKYEPLDVDAITRQLQLEISLLYDNNHVFNDEAKKTVSPLHLINYAPGVSKTKLPETFPYLQHVTQLRELIKEREVRAKRDCVVLEVDNPWGSPLVEILETGQFKYNIYDPVGFVGFEDAIQELIKDRADQMTMRKPWHRTNRRRNLETYYNTWMSDYIFYMKLGMMWWDLEGMKRRLDDVPLKRDYKADNGMVISYKIPEEARNFLDAQRAALQAQQDLIVKLQEGAGGGTIKY